MCFGLPMEVVSTDGPTAVARRGDEIRRISLALTGPIEQGTHVLVHVDTAIRTLEPDEAHLLDRAVAGLEAAARGETDLPGFEDLVGREPRLPPHLEAQRQARSSAGPSSAGSDLAAGGAAPRRASSEPRPPSFPRPGSAVFETVATPSGDEP